MPNEVKISVKADTAQAEQSVNQFASGSLGGKIPLGAAAAGVAVVGLGIKAISTAADFEKAFTEVTTLFDAPKSQVEALREGVKDLSAEMGIDATEAAQALYQAISAGVAPENAIDFLRQNTKLAVGGVTDLTSAVDLSTTVMNAWGLEANQLQGVHDALFTTVRLGKTTVEELSGAMFNIAPVAANAGVSVDEVGAALAALTAKGTPTTVATTELRQAILALTAPTKEQAKAAQEMGVTLDKATLESQGLAGTMLALTQAAGGNDAELRRVVGSTEALQAVLGLADNNARVFNTNMDAMGDKAGATNEAFDKMEETFSRDLDKALAQVNLLLIELGETVIPAVSAALETLIPILEDVNSLMEGFGATLRFVQGDTDGVIGSWKDAGQAALGLEKAVRPLNPAAQAVFGAFSLGKRMTLEWKDSLEGLGATADEATQSNKILGSTSIETADRIVATHQPLMLTADLIVAMSGTAEEEAPKFAGAIEADMMPAIIAVKERADEAREALFNMFTEPTKEEQLAEAALAAYRLEAFRLEQKSGDLTSAEQRRLDQLTDKLIPAQEDAITELTLTKEATSAYATVAVSSAPHLDEWTKAVGRGATKVQDIKGDMRLLTSFLNNQWQSGWERAQAGIDGFSTQSAQTELQELKDAFSSLGSLIGFGGGNGLPQGSFQTPDQLLSGQAGLTVPGLPGQPRMVMAHGGEEIVSADRAESRERGTTIIIERLEVHGGIMETLGELGVAV